MSVTMCVYNIWGNKQSLQQVQAENIMALIKIKA